MADNARGDAGSMAKPNTASSPTSPMVRRSTGNTLDDSTSTLNRDRGDSSASKSGGRIRSGSRKFMESNPPLGFMSATGEIAARAPSLSNIRNNSYGSNGSRRGSFSSAKEGRDRGASTASPTTPTLKSPTIPEIDFNASEFATTSAPPQDASTTTQPQKRVTRDFADMIESGEFELSRGKMDNQAYVKRENRQKNTITPIAADDASDDDGDDDSLADLDPKPKRRSKNMAAMLGEDVDASNTPRNNEGSSSKRNTRDFADMIESGDYDLGRGKMNDQSYTRSARPPKPTTNMTGAGFDGAPTVSDDLGAESSHKGYSGKLDDMYGAGASKNSSTHNVPATLVATDPARSSHEDTTKIIGPDENGYYPNGYHFPAKKTWQQSTMVGLKASWKFLYANWYNWLIVLYGLNVVAWGGMLFLLLIGGGKQFMCFTPQGTYDCNDLYCPRRIWIEIDSQILNSLFCVTGFGLAPWRFRDLWFLLKWRIGKNYSGLRRLAGFHNGWFRLAGSQDLPVKLSDPTEFEDNPATPIPAKMTPPEPLTGIRAPPTALWRMDYVVWAFVINTFLQVILSFFMWHYNRFVRPSWSTGLFVALACIVAALGGFMQFTEGNKIKKVEGVPLPDEAGNVNRQRDMETNTDLGLTDVKGKEPDVSKLAAAE